MGRLHSGASAEGEIGSCLYPQQCESPHPDERRLRVMILGFTHVCWWRVSHPSTTKRVAGSYPKNSYEQPPMKRTYTAFP